MMGQPADWLAHFLLAPAQDVMKLVSLAADSRWKGGKKRQNADLDVALSGPFGETLPGRAAAAVTAAMYVDNLPQVMSAALT